VTIDKEIERRKVLTYNLKKGEATLYKAENGGSGGKRKVNSRLGITQHRGGGQIITSSKDTQRGGLKGVSQDHGRKEETSKEKGENSLSNK